MSYVDVTMSIYHAYYECIKIEIQNSETKIAINGSSDIFCLPVVLDPHQRAHTPFETAELC